MRTIRIVIAVLAAFSITVPAQAHWRVSSTAYCLTSRTASGGHGYPGSVATHTWLPLGAKIKTSHKIFGRRYFRVNDRADRFTDLDVWTPSCSQAIRYGRHVVTIHWIR